MLERLHKNVKILKCLTIVRIELNCCGVLYFCPLGGARTLYISASEDQITVNSFYFSFLCISSCSYLTNMLMKC